MRKYIDKAIYIYIYIRYTIIFKKKPFFPRIEREKKKKKGEKYERIGRKRKGKIEGRDKEKHGGWKGVERDTR